MFIVALFCFVQVSFCSNSFLISLPKSRTKTFLSHFLPIQPTLIKLINQISYFLQVPDMEGLCALIYRALPFLRMGEDFVDRNGVKGLDYWMDENVFANESVHSFNACFENNLRSGLQNISLCKSQGGLASPIFLSLPHYYAADSFYLQQFAQGSEISPDRHLHLPRIVLEPVIA